MEIAPGSSAEILSISDRRTRIIQLRAETGVDQAIQTHGHVRLPRAVFSSATRSVKPFLVATRPRRLTGLPPVAQERCFSSQ
jgi:hypothetical protein